MPYNTHIKFPSNIFPDKISDIEVTNISEDQNTIFGISKQQCIKQEIFIYIHHVQFGRDYPRQYGAEA